MNISHDESISNNGRVVPAHFSSPNKTLDSASLHSSSNSQELLQKPHSHKITKPKAARLVRASHDLDAAGFMDQADNADHNNHTSSELPTTKTITVLISFLKLSKYDDEWLKLGKQLLLLKKAPNKQKLYRSALCCFKSAIKAHPDNHVAYYFSGITLCLLRRYVEVVKMFDLSLRYNKETSTALMYTLSEMLSITEGMRLATSSSNSGNSDASIQQGSSSNNVDSAFNKSLDKLEQKIINKLQRCKIDGAVDNNMINNKQYVTNGDKAKDKISVSAEQEQADEI